MENCIPEEEQLNIEIIMSFNENNVTEEMAAISGKGFRTIKRHIANMPPKKYVGSGYSGHWTIDKKD